MSAQDFPPPLMAPDAANLPVSGNPGISRLEGASTPPGYRQFGQCPLWCWQFLLLLLFQLLLFVVSSFFRPWPLLRPCHQNCECLRPAISAQGALLRASPGNWRNRLVKHFHAPPAEVQKTNRNYPARVDLHMVYSRTG